MKNEQQVSTSKRSEDLDWGFEGHRRRQVRLGLGLSLAERLRWLEKSMEELRKLVGRARRPARLSKLDYYAKPGTSSSILLRVL